MIAESRWTDFFARYQAIVLVANSDDASVHDLGETLPAGTLFVFFNEATRVLDRPFDRDAILVARSGRAGPAIVRKNKLPAIVERFVPGCLKTIVNLCADTSEAPAGLSRFRDVPVDRLDLTAFFEGRYTAGKTPSSGYAMAAWLTALPLEADLVLSGFTALRSDRWKVFDVHDWVLEQAALRLLIRTGRARPIAGPARGPSALEALTAQCPEASQGDILSVYAEILSERLEHTNGYVDRLWSMARPMRFVRGALKRLR